VIRYDATVGVQKSVFVPVGRSRVRVSSCVLTVLGAVVDSMESPFGDSGWNFCCGLELNFRQARAVTSHATVAPLGKP
jgi:heme A synthase